jgi:hypothetical protein
MFSSRQLVIACLASFAATMAFAAPIPAPDLHAKIIELYSFQPHTLNDAQLTAKSAQLDTFWKLVKDDPTSTLPLLRAELANPSNPSFFHYDGAKLLLSLSSDAEDQRLALRSIVKADLQDIQPTDYLLTVHRLAAQGFDTRDAALHVLDDPDFIASIPLHALRLGQNYSLIYMLFPMDEDSFVPALVDRLSGQQSATSVKSVLLALWCAATPESLGALRKFAEARQGPPEAVSYAQKLQGAKGFVPSLSSLSSLREERRRLMRRPISDEALIEFESLTRKIQAKQ